MSIPRTDCPDCKNMAWHGPVQQPVRVDGEVHHPSCPRLAPRDPGVRVTTTGFNAAMRAGRAVAR